jgi:hypothetical protein
MKPAPAYVVVDDFLADPDAIRALALRQKFEPDVRYFKGKRSEQQFMHEFDHTVLGKLLHREIVDWPHHGMNGRFQICLPGEDPLVFHADGQTHAATIYLTPNAPPGTGLSLYRSRVTGLRRPSRDQAINSMMFDGNLLDPTKWEEVDRIGNVYNRLVVWDATLIHAASGYFGNNLSNGRLFWMFFFDCR